MKQKIVSSLDAAVADIPDGARIMFGGFGGAGFPNNLIQALSRKGIKNVIRDQQQLRDARRRIGNHVQEWAGEARDLLVSRAARELFSGTVRQRVK